MHRLLHFSEYTFTNLPCFAFHYSTAIIGADFRATTREPRYGVCRRTPVTRSSKECVAVKYGHPSAIMRVRFTPAQPPAAPFHTQYLRIAALAAGAHRHGRSRSKTAAGGAHSRVTRADARCGTNVGTFAVVGVHDIQDSHIALRNVSERGVQPRRRQLRRCSAHPKVLKSIPSSRGLFPRFTNSSTLNPRLHSAAVQYGFVPLFGT